MNYAKRLSRVTEILQAVDEGAISPVDGVAEIRSSCEDAPKPSEAVETVEELVDLLSLFSGKLTLRITHENRGGAYIHSKIQGARYADDHEIILSLL